MRKCRNKEIFTWIILLILGYGFTLHDSVILLFHDLIFHDSHTLKQCSGPLTLLFLSTELFSFSVSNINSFKVPQYSYLATFEPTNKLD